MRENNARGEKERFFKKFKLDELEVVSGRYWVISTRYRQTTYGSVVIASTTESALLTNISSDEWEELGRLIGQTYRVLHAVTGCDAFNSMQLMLEDQHPHIHIFPRYKSCWSSKHDAVVDPVGWPKPLKDLSASLFGIEKVKHVNRGLVDAFRRNR